MDRVKPLELDAAQTARLAELAPTIDGKPDISKIESIDLQGLTRDFRTQRIVFETARDVYDQMQENWPGDRTFLLAQLVRLVEQFIRSGNIGVTPDLFGADDLKRRLVITLNMTKVVQHIWEAIRHENAARIEPVFDRDQPIRATGDIRTWFTGKPCAPTARSHINFCVFDSTWEASDTFALDHAPEVEAWVKNDHLGFEVFYVHRGVVRKIPSRLPDPAHVGRHAGARNQGPRQRPRPDQAPLPCRMGRGRQRAWRIRTLGLGCRDESRRNPRHPRSPLSR